MSDKQGQSGSRLFTLRVWSEDTGPGQSEWRGKLHDLASGDSTYFRDWEGLTTCLTTLLVGPSPPSERQSKPVSEANRLHQPVANDSSTPDSEGE